MDDDGRSGRWMARGSMGKLTHLEAFLSDDAKRGRVWTCGKIEYKRGQTQWPEVMYREAGCGVWNNYPWQLAESTEPVYWADEPKLLTPQEALRALADGRVIEDGDFRFRLGSFGKIETLHIEETEWEPMEDLCFVGCHIVPDPSQPAEPAKPPLKVGDRVKDTRVRSRSGTVVGLCNDDRLVKVNYDDIGVINGSQVEYLEKIEAEPQLSPCSCMGDASCSCRRARIVDGGK